MGEEPGLARIIRSKQGLRGWLELAGAELAAVDGVGCVQSRCCGPLGGCVWVQTTRGRALKTAVRLVASLGDSGHGCDMSGGAELSAATATVLAGAKEP